MKAFQYLNTASRLIYPFQFQINLDLCEKKNQEIQGFLLLVICSLNLGFNSIKMETRIMCIYNLGNMLKNHFYRNEKCGNGVPRFTTKNVAF